jgi:hypothetical protein
MRLFIVCRQNDFNFAGNTFCSSTLLQENKALINRIFAFKKHKAVFLLEMCEDAQREIVSTNKITRINEATHMK